MTRQHPQQDRVQSRPVSPLAAALAMVLIVAGPLLFAAEGPPSEGPPSGGPDGVTRAQGLLDANDRARALEVLEDWMHAHPDDDRGRFLYARVLAWEGRYADALAEYDHLLDAHPGDVDYLLGKGQVLLWAGDAAAAVETLSRARRLAPSYEELWRLELSARVAGRGSRQELDVFVDQARDRFPAAAWTDYVLPARGSVEAGFTYDNLNSGFSSWQELYVTGRYQLGERRAFFGQVRDAKRFDQSDEEIMAGFSFPIAQSWSVVLEGSLAPKAQVLPEWSVSSQVRRGLPFGLGAHFGWRHAEYLLSDVDLLTVGGDFWRGQYRAAYTVYGASINGGPLVFSHGVQLDRYYHDRNRISLVASIGEQVESVGNDLFIVNDVATLTLTGQHALNERWAVSWELGQAWSDIYDRQRFRAGLTRQF